jgi:UDP-glucose 4-epimerase
MKSLILGSNGYLGRHITRAIRHLGWQANTADLQDTAWDGDPSYRRCDMRRKEDLHKLDWDVDWVWLFGGLSGTTVGFERYEDYIDVNEKGLVGVLEIVRAQAQAGCRPKIIFPSSRLVYLGKKGVPLKEDDEFNSLTVYSVNKRAAEMYLELYRKVFGLRYTVFRICVPYGNLLDDEYSYGTTGFFMRYARAGADIPIYGDGAQQRTFTHVDDLCQQLILAAGKAESEGRVLNVAGGDDLAILAAAQMIADHFGVRVKSIPWPELDRACESGDTIFDSSAIRALTGYACRHRFQDWVASLPCSKAVSEQ